MNAVISVGYTNMMQLLSNPDRITALRELGKIIGESALCGTKSSVQGQMLLLLAICEGVPITEIRRKYHIVNGTDLSMRADYMRAEFRRMGGTYHWINTGEDGQVATLEVEYKENKQVVSYSIDDAKKEGLIKPGSRWTKQPGDMLRARVSTKAIRMVASEVIAGFATDEELQSGADDGSTFVVPVLDSVSEPLKLGFSQVMEAVTSTSVLPSAQTETANPAVVTTETDATGVTMITDDQVRELEQRYKACNISLESQTEALRKRCVNSVRELSEEQGTELISKLRALAVEPMIQQVAVHDDAGPVVEETYNKIQEQIKVIAQKPGTGPAFVETVRSHLTKSGFALKDLTQGEALKLLEAINKSDVKIFLGVELHGYQSNDAEGKG